MTNTIQVRLWFVKRWLRPAVAMYILAVVFERLGDWCMDKAVRIEL